MMRRFLYLVYYIKETDFNKFRKYVRYASDKTGIAGCRIVIDSLLSVFRYNTSLLDYFYFRFYELTGFEREKWAGTGYMYEYQLKMNPKESRMVLEDKLQFSDHFKEYITRRIYSLEELSNNVPIRTSILVNSSNRLVLKGSRGQVGAEVEVISCSDFDTESLISYMIKNGYDMIEDYVIQHSSLNKLSPSGLNTVRVFTQLYNGNVSFLGARLRVSVNSLVDNMGAGNLAAPIDIKTGKVNGPGVYSDITKKDKTFHPVTGAAIEGFFVPYWQEVKVLAEKASRMIPENKSVGWDIAIKEEGPELIEGNHNWCKLLWQLPVKKGLKHELQDYIKWKRY